VRDFGPDEALALMRAQNEPAELVVRSSVPVGEPTEVPGAYRLERDALESPPDGWIWQSRGSQLAALALGSSDGERILDACAAPGAKATMLRGEVTAVELHLGRARELEENARRIGATNVHVVNTDVRELEASGFDRALVDAPCSGLGVLARRPDLRWRATPLPGLQIELIHAAAERTKPGGTLLYSVCTLNADENEAVVDATGLEPEPLGDEWPAFAHPTRPEFLLTSPHRHGTSGFFIARLRV
jgi:16S rRNA (cytosine967-C5)-methyltransferase